MKLSTRTKLALSVLSLLLCTSALTSAAPATRVDSAALHRDVIVILRNQLPDVSAAQHSARAAAIAAAQAPVLAHLHASGASRVRGFQTINAVAARVSPAEADALSQHPLVQSVVEDRILRLPPRSTRSAANVGASASASSGVDSTSSALCDTLEPEALQVMNVAFDDPSKAQAQRLIDGNGNLIIGTGVTVAYIADGIDTTVAGFTRPDGSKVFVDSQNFNGDPAGAPTAGGEAFLDASSIAANDMPNGKALLFDISQFVNAAHPLPSPCNIRIRGVAPGASLVGLNVFSNSLTTTSNFVQAIEYAVYHDNVDVINESFGGNPYPDTDNDPISLADHAAADAGVVVVVSTGDAGYNGTLGSPSTDPWVISAGASTTFRFYEQVGYYATQFATNGWLNNNISALSSGGFSQTGPYVPDVIAPGDLGWALCSTNAALYTDCTNYQTSPGSTPVESAGGTSESSPLTAGTAALVIQAYRSTHHGKNPTPALVKQIIMSTAGDIGAPPSEQGAGLVNAYAAVLAALSVSDQNSNQNAQNRGNTPGVLLNSPTSASVTDQPGTPESLSFAITNTGSSSMQVAPHLDILGPAIVGATQTVTLDPAKDPTFVGPFGDLRAYITQTFVVPAGAQHLDAAIAWQAPYTMASTLARVTLIDPQGHYAAYSLPQGSGSSYGHVDVVNPAAGTWTAIIFTVASANGYSGPVQFSWAAEKYVPFGTVSPANLNIAPGQTQWVTAYFRMPAQAGDQGVALRFGSNSGFSEIPIALRTLIPIGTNGGSFGGTLTGGNGRPGTGPVQTFAFDVPQGVNNMNLSLQISDPLYILQGYLIAPNGMQMSVQGNFDFNGNTGGAMELDRANPMPGRWHFVLLVDFYTSGNQVSLPFTAQIGFNSAQISAGGLPNGPHAKLSASGLPVVVPINITNTTGLTQEYFADARLNTLTALQLGTQGQCRSQLPYSCFATVLPTQVHSAQFLAKAGAPITMDAYNSVGYFVGATGSPDLYASPVGRNTVAATITQPEVPWGLWWLIPSLIGPYGPAGASSTPVTTAVQLVMKPFDASAVADSGDFWSDVTFGTSTFNPLVLGPGQSGTIHVTITPNSTQIDQTVSGVIYIDTYNPLLNWGDEVKSFPYNYTIAP